MLQYQIEFRARIGAEVCPRCCKAMVLAEHTGFLRCFAKDCVKLSTRRIYVSDGDVAMLPFGADTPYHGLFSQKQPDYETRFGRDAATGRVIIVVEQGDAVKKLLYASSKNAVGGSPVGVSAGAGNGMMSVESTSELAAKNGGIMMCNDPNFHAIEVVFSFNRPRRAGAKVSATSTNKREMVMKSGAVELGSWCPADELMHYIALQLCNIACRGKCFANGSKSTCVDKEDRQQKNCCNSGGESDDDSFLKSSSSSISQSTILYGVEDESHDDGEAVHEHFGSCGNVYAAGMSKTYFSALQYKACDWMTNPINIAELKLIMSKVAQDSGDSDWSRLSKNPWFLTKIFSTLYNFSPIKLTDAQLRVATAKFQDAQSMIKHMSLVSQPAKLATSKRTTPSTSSPAEDETPRRANNKKRPSPLLDMEDVIAVKKKICTSASEIRKHISGSPEETLNAIDDEAFAKALAAEMHFRETPTTASKNAAATSTTSSSAQDDSTTITSCQQVPHQQQTARQFKSGYVWFRIFRSMFENNPAIATILPHFFAIPTDKDKLEMLDKWWTIVCDRKNWTEHDSPLLPKYGVRVISKARISLV